MQYRLEYFNTDGSLRKAGDDLAFSLFRIFGSLEEAKTFKASLDELTTTSLLLRSEDGVAWEGIEEPTNEP